MNNVRVLTVKSAASETEFSVHFLVTGACQNIFSHRCYLYVETDVIDVVCGCYLGV